MKKLLMGAAILSLFGISVVIVQTSCQKSNAQSPTGSVTNQNLILTSLLNSDSTLALYNYEGVLLRQIQPSSPVLDFSKYKITEAKLSPDGKLIFVHVKGYSISTPDAIYVMDNYGNNVKQIINQNAGIRYLDIK